VTRLRVGVNLLWLVPGVVGGSEEYTTRLLAGVAEAAPPDIEVVLFTLRPFGDAYPDIVSAFPTRVAPLQGRSKALRVAAEASWLAWKARRERVDLVHHAGGTMPLLRSRPGMLTIHDLQPLVLPDHFSALKQMWLRRRLPPSVRNARIVVTLTEDTRRSVIVILGAQADRVVLVPPGIGLAADPGAGSTDASDDPAETYDIHGPFFLYPAITYPHKNHALLIHAFARVAARRPDVLLVLTGGTAASETDVAAAIEGLDLADRVRRLNRIPRPDLEWLFRHAVALTFPSRFEGFGLPVLEAMAVGCPVVAAATTALPEVVGDAGVLLPADDPDPWTSAMLDLLENRARREQLAAAGRARAADFSWAGATGKLLAAYRLAARAVAAGDRP